MSAPSETSSDTSADTATPPSDRASFDPHRDGGFDPQPGVARLTHADQARTLAGGSGRGMLSTIAREPEGYPFGSLVTYLADEGGAPWVLISTMAEHTRNALLDPRASLMISEEAPTGVDPLALARLSLVGLLIQATPEPEFRDRFLERHPGTQVYVDFPDFSWWRLDIAAIRYVGGFGRMSWVEPSDYATAIEDPIAGAAQGICDHMNEDHADAQVDLIRHYLDRPDITSALMVSVDRLGCDFDTVSASGSLPLRLSFPEPVNDSLAVRKTFVAMLHSIKRTTQA
jgi:heme iron utilization protein